MATRLSTRPTYPKETPAVKASERPNIAPGSSPAHEGAGTLRECWSPRHPGCRRRRNPRRGNCRSCRIRGTPQNRRPDNASWCGQLHRRRPPDRSPRTHPLAFPVLVQRAHPHEPDLGPWIGFCPFSVWSVTFCSSARYFDTDTRLNRFAASSGTRLQIR